MPERACRSRRASYGVACGFATPASALTCPRVAPPFLNVPFAFPGGEEAEVAATTPGHPRGGVRHPARRGVAPLWQGVAPCAAPSGRVWPPAAPPILAGF